MTAPAIRPTGSFALRAREPLPCGRRLGLCLNHLSQTFNRGKDHLGWVTTKTKHKRGCRSGCNIQAAHSPDDDAVLASRSLDGDVGETAPREGNKMHALVRRIDG